MRTYLVAFGLSLLLSFALTRVVRDLARRWGLHDEGGGRKIHRAPVPRLGGVAVAIAALVPLGALLFWDNKLSRELAADTGLLVGLLGGGGIMLVVGLVDDLRGARAWVKFAGQIAAALVVYQAGIRIEAVSVPFFHPIRFDWWLSLPATVFWMVLVMNAINLIDGLDGLAGGVVVLAGGTLFVMSVVEDNTLAALLLAVAVGGTLGFLPYNVARASIFLGDTGSLWLGFVLALVSVHSAQKSYALFSIVAALLALGLPIFDLSMAVVRRYLSGQPIFRADQHHVHHILLRKGLTQSQSVVLLFGAAVVLEALAFLFIYADDAISALAVAALFPLIFVAVRLLGYGELIRSARRARVLDQIEQEARSQRALVAAFRRRLAAADDPEAAWEALAELAGELRYERVSLELSPEDGAEGRWRWSARDEAAIAAVHHESLIEAERAVGGGRLVVARWRERAVFAPHDEAIIDAVADGLRLWLAGKGRPDARSA